MTEHIVEESKDFTTEFLSLLKQPFAVITIPSELAPSLVDAARRVSGESLPGPSPTARGISGNDCKYKISSVLDKDFDFTCRERD